MASVFDSIDALAQDVIEGQTGEEVSFVGMETGEYVRTADPERPAQTSTAVVSQVPKTGHVSDGIQGRSSTRAARSFASSELWMSAASFAALDWAPVKDDKVILAPGGPGEAAYTISGVYPLEQGDVQIIINAGGRDA